VKYRIIIGRSAEKELGRISHEKQQKIAANFCSWRTILFPWESLLFKAGKAFEYESVIIGFSMKWMRLPTSLSSPQ
jgi:hypothetical protein